MVSAVDEWNCKLSRENLFKDISDKGYDIRYLQLNLLTITTVIFAVGTKFSAYSHSIFSNHLMVHDYYSGVQLRSDHRWMTRPIANSLSVSSLFLTEKCVMKYVSIISSMRVVLVNSPIDEVSIQLSFVDVAQRSFLR